MNDRQDAYRAIAAGIRALVQHLTGLTPEELPAWLAGTRQQGRERAAEWENAPKIAVVCRAASHPSRVVKIGRLRADGSADADAAVDFFFGTADPNRHNDNVTNLVGDRVLPVGEYGFTQRSRAEFECSLCGLRIVARYEHLAPLLQGLHGQGVSVVDLQTIHQYLRKHVTAS